MTNTDTAHDDVRELLESNRAMLDRACNWIDNDPGPRGPAEEAAHTKLIKAIDAEIARIDTALATTTQPDNELAHAADSEPSVLADELATCPNVKYAQLRPFDAPEQFLVPEPLRDRILTALRNQPSVDDVIEQCAKVADNYARTQREAGADGSFEAADIAEHIAQAIRALKGGGA